MTKHPLTTLLAGSALALHAAAGLAAPLNFCYESADVRPWRTANGSGLNFELINAAARQEGIEIKYHGLPWKRCLVELKMNAMDGALGASFKADRLEIGAYPGGRNANAEQRLHVDRYVVVRRKGSAVRWDGKAFHKLDGAVGIQLGYSIGEQLQSLNLPVDDGSQTARELLMKLTAGRLGAAAMLASEIEYLVRQDAALAGKIDILPRPLVEKPYFLLLSHRLVMTDTALAERLWKAIEKERNSAAYRKLEKSALAGGSN